MKFVSVRRIAWAAILLVAVAIGGCGHKAAPSGIAATIVYVAPAGKRYHLKSCRYVRKAKTAKTLQEAVDEGYTPCKVCHPPALEGSK